MKIINGDLWEQPGWKVVPTNLSLSAAGLAIMVRGVAKQALIKYPNLRAAYGRDLFAYHNDNQPSIFLYSEPAGDLICLPIKLRWAQKADLDLIERGVRALAERKELSQVALPLLGCGFGELDPLTVLRVLARWLDDRFVLVLRDQEATQRYAETLKPGARRDRTLYVT